MTRTRTLLAAAVVLAAALGGGLAEAQCAMCQTVLSGSAEGRAMSQSLNHAILLMFFAPYAVIGTFVTFAFRRRWQPALLRGLRRVLSLF